MNSSPAAFRRGAGSAKFQRRPASLPLINTMPTSPDSSEAAARLSPSEPVGKNVRIASAKQRSRLDWDWIPARVPR